MLPRTLLFDAVLTRNVATERRHDHLLGIESSTETIKRRLQSNAGIQLCLGPVISQPCRSCDIDAVMHDNTGVPLILEQWMQSLLGYRPCHCWRF